MLGLQSAVIGFWFLFGIWDYEFGFSLFEGLEHAGAASKSNGVRSRYGFDALSMKRAMFLLRRGRDSSCRYIM
jgi:hypothetical protein